MTRTYTLPLSPFVVQHGPMPQTIPSVREEHDFTDHERLERYFDDLYHLALYKLVHFAYLPVISAKEKQKLQQIVAELIRVKKILEEGLRVD